MTDVSEAIAELKKPTVPDDQIRYKAWKVQNVAYKKAFEDKSYPLKGITYPPSRSELEDINALVAGIPAAFEQFLTPHPKTVYSVGNKCGAGIATLEKTTASSSLAGLKSDLPDDFKGAASDSFFTNYVDVHGAITANQVDAIAAVANAINADAMIYHNARATILKIADKAIETLEGGVKDGGKVLLLVAGTLTALAATVVSGGTAGPAAFWANAAFAASIATTTTTGAINGFYINKEIVGGSVEDTLKSMKDALDHAKEAMRDQQNQLADNIQSARGQLWRMWNGELPDGHGGYDTTDLNYDINGKEGSMLIAHQAAG